MPHQHIHAGRGAICLICGTGLKSSDNTQGETSR